MALKMAIALGLWVVAHVANAGPVTLVGNSVNYVYEENQAAVALFGTPMIIGDLVAFRPGAFRAQSLNGAGTDTAAAEFIFSSVYSRDGAALGGVGLFEFGDYELVGGGSVGAKIELTMDDNNSSNSASDSTDFAENLVPGSLQFWILTLDMDLQSALGAATNDISLAISNTLTATSDALADGAWIQKKLAFAAVTNTGVSVPTTNPPAEVVPLPGVLALFGVGLVAMGGVKRRKPPV